MALAPLGFTVDTGPVAKAVADLEHLTSATAKAEAGTKGITAPTTAAASATRQLGAASAAAATQMTIATNAVRANNAALAINNAEARATQQSMRNLAFQFQDIGTMLISGQSPFMLLAQQLPQVTIYGGRLTGVMGALRSTLAGLFSPLGLLTTGFVLAGSAAISYFTSTNDEADAAAEALAEQEDLIRRVADRWGDAVPALREYANEMQRARDEAELASGVQAAANRAWDDARQILPDLKTEIGGIVQELIRANQTDANINALRDAFNEADRAAQDLRAAIADGTAEADDFQRVTDALASLMANEGVSGADQLQAMVAELRDRYGEAADEAIRLAEAQAVALAGGPIGGRSRIAAGKGDRSGAGPSTLREDEFARRFGWGEYFNFPRDRKPRRGRKTDEERSADRYADLIRSSEQYIAMQELEQQALFMTEEAANALRYEQELLNQAANDNIKLTPEMAAELKGLVAQMAAAEAETTRLNEAFRFVGDVARGFFDDVFSALEDGKSLWEGFAQAGLNALQRIADKLIDMAMDELITGLLGSILGAIGGGFPSLPSSAPIPTPRPSFAGGGYTGRGPRSGGIDGKGGFPAILHPNETVIDHTRQSANQNHANQNININVNVAGARGNSEIMDMVGRGVREGLREFTREAGPAMVKAVVNDPRAVG